MYTPTRRTIAATAALASALFLAGCADDDDPIASPSEAVSTPTASASAAPSVDEFCDAKVAIDAAFLQGGPPEEEEGSESASPDPTVIGEGISASFSAPYEDLARTAQPEVKDSVDKLVAGLEDAIEEGNPEFFMDPEFVAADQVVDDFLKDKCDVEEIAATAADFEFEGLPTSSPEGLTALTLTNEGEEFHEMVVMRINDDVTESIEELLQMDEEETEGKIQPMGVVLAAPGTTATNFFDLTAGRYAVLCFISEGSDAEHEFQGEGPPHFTKGMVEELTILGAGETASPSSTSDSGSESSSGSASASEAEATSSSSDSSSGSVSGSSSSSTASEESASPEPTS